ncbi:ATP-binding protein [Actinobaculum sp. 352]|uniref:ATP-binding protein n=2 Tax=unclassified Actinobaculum TaxID=2609299 RepID=UPI000F7D6B18|nr:ATP-binding protein [Actinobaculum sp. 352]RTE49065.1 hypothetical protein EKN07_08030 [Actinobaculum sp. 352]
MGILQSLSRTFGIPEALSVPLPHYRLLSDGLIVSDDRAQAWFTVSAASSQMLTVQERADEAGRVITAAQRILGDRACQLRIMWGRIDGATYTPGHEMTPWAQARRQGISDLGLAERHVLLGIDIEDRHTAAVLQALRRATDWVGGDARAIPRRELASLDRTMRQFARMLQDTPLRARPAPVETLAWMLAHDQYRTMRPLAGEGTVTGARLARLTRGRAIPWPDHIRHYGADGTETAYTTLLALSEFPEKLEVPGNGEWLLTLSRVSRRGIEGEPDEVRIYPQADVRFEVLTSAAGLGKVEKVRKSAKEQRREASRSSAGETDLNIAMAEAEMEQLAAEIQRGRVELVHASCIISVTEASREALEASVTALQAHYAEYGITVDVLADQQREAWMQTMPCDQVRTGDLSHVMDAPAFFGSWFWGGSVVGDDVGPAIGYTTGATASIVRLHPTEAPRRGDTSTIAIVGKGGRGKTTAMQLLALDAADEGAWVPLLDLKGDLDNQYGGIVACAAEYGIPADAVAVDGRFAGAADLLRLSTPEEALSASHGQLMLLISEALRVRAQPVLMEHIARLVESGEERSTARLINIMAASADDTAQRIAGELTAWRSDIYGSAIVGRADGGALLGTGPGIHLIRCPGMVPPAADTPPADWSTSERVQAAVIRGLLAWLTQIGSRQTLRDQRKMVCLPEAHMLTATREGAAFLDRTARMGRAMGQTLVVDTQDTASIADHDGIMEQLVAVMAFSQDTEAQQTALAKLLGLEPTEAARIAVRDVSVDPHTGAKWSGHCYMRDPRRRVASVQIAYPNSRVADLLSTDPTHARKEAA